MSVFWQIFRLTLKSPETPDHWSLAKTQYVVVVWNTVFKTMRDSQLAHILQSAHGPHLANGLWSNKTITFYIFLKCNT